MANPHFVRVAARCQGTSLLVTFQLAGLGANELVTVTASALATATYACVNRGGRRPQAANKMTVVEDVSVSGEFTSDRSGQVRGSLSIPAPSPGDFSCPPGQTLILECVSFEQVEVNAIATTGTASRDVPGTFQCVACP